MFRIFADELYVSPKTTVFKKYADKTVIDECEQRVLDSTNSLVCYALCVNNINVQDVNSNIPFIGKAKCMDGDEYNVDVGQSIAENKANMKYHASMAKKYNQLERLFTNAVHDMQKMKKVHETKVDNIKYDLEKFGG